MNFKKTWKDIWTGFYSPYGCSPSIGFIGTIFLVAIGSVSLWSYSDKLDFEKNKKQLQVAYKAGQTRIVAEVLDKRYAKKLTSPEPVYRLRTQKGKEIGLSIIDSEDKNNESLDILIQKGSIISFPKGNIQRDKTTYGYSKIKKETYFQENTQFGNKRADRIRIE